MPITARGFMINTLFGSLRRRRSVHKVLRTSQTACSANPIRFVRLPRIRFWHDRVSMKIAIVLLIAIAAPPAGAPQSIYQRPIEAGAVISGSPKLRDGSYQLTGTAAMCGEIPKEASLTGEATFVIE